MGYDYWLVHLIWTLPPGLLMTAIYWPFFTRLEVYKICTLITIAVLATTPWDSYLVRNKIWSYPGNAVVGPTLFAVPLEECFFFVIQTYNTCLVYLMLTKRLVLPVYLGRPGGIVPAVIGMLIISAGLALGALGVWLGGKLTYMGLILAWVCPFMMLQWTMCSRFLLALPGRLVFLSIALPSIYLCMVDNLALQRGTWVIEQQTKLGIQVWGSLDIEEFVFFWVTNIMIVFGLVSIDHAIAIAEHHIAKQPGPFPSFGRLVLLYLSDRRSDCDVYFLQGLAEAVETVSRKSQSMYIGSAMFQGGLRIDLLLLYYFCRVMDDLVDEAPDREAAGLAIEQCLQALGRRFIPTSPQEEKEAFPGKGAYQGRKEAFQKEQDPLYSSLRYSISLLPASRLSIGPLLGLLAGLRTDLAFCAERHEFPIATEEHLETYAYRVASVVALSVIQLVFSHHDEHGDRGQQQRIMQAAEKMGQALQYVNIARDVERDAAIGRVYLPTSWLAAEELTPADVIAEPHDARITRLRDRMLVKADGMYRASRDAMDELPREMRGPIRAVVESYMAIGDEVRRGNRGKGVEKLKLSPWTRFWIVWRAMYR